jgi:hypothetical protein
MTPRQAITVLSERQAELPAIFFHCCSMAIGSFLGEELDQFRAGLGFLPLALACLTKPRPIGSRFLKTSAEMAGRALSPRARPSRLVATTSVMRQTRVRFGSFEDMCVAKAVSALGQKQTYAAQQLMSAKGQ